MVGGGFNEVEEALDVVELISLDPINFPVPSCSKFLPRFYLEYAQSAGAMMKRGKFT